MKTKKIITMALSLAMLSSVTVFAVSSASAADSSANVDIEVSSVTAAAGEQIAIPVNVNIPAPGIAGCEFSFTYDPAVLTITSIAEGNISGGSGAADEELKKIQTLLTQ
jgi:predicted secreted protein